jgi:hypothetical protein
MKKSLKNGFYGQNFRKGQESSSEDDEKITTNSSSSYQKINQVARVKENEEEIIEIDSDDSRDALSINNNQESSPDRNRTGFGDGQNNNADSDQESTSSDVVVISDDYKTFHEEIEQLSRITSRGMNVFSNDFYFFLPQNLFSVQLNPEDKVSIKNFKIHKLLVRMMVLENNIMSV